MVQRLATDYVKTRLVLNDEQFSEMMLLLVKHKLRFTSKALENGDQEVRIAPESGTDPLVLLFERKDGNYVSNVSCRCTDLKLANALRMAVAQFKGEAFVRRIYPSYTLEYEYRSGAVFRITEVSVGGERLVYERKVPSAVWMKRLHDTSVEAEILAVKQEVDGLLDRRNRCRDTTALQAIDQGLTRLARRLFALEA